MKLKNISGIAPTRSIPRMLVLAMLVAVLWLLSGGTQPAEAGPPPNDNFVDATPLQNGVTIMQTTVGALVNETGEPQPCASIARTVWFTFQPPVDEIVTVVTFGSNYDTALAVYSGSVVDNLKVFGCDNDNGNTASEVTFTARAGVIYHIQAGGTAGTTGLLDLTLTGVDLGGFPTVMNYQGLLFDPNPNLPPGTPVQDDAYDVTFSIYRSAFIGGTALWTETQKVTTKNGLFDVLLGSSEPLTADVFDDETRFLELQVNQDAPMERQRFASVAYAFLANTADGLSCDPCFLDGDLSIGEGPGIAPDTLFFDAGAESLAWSNFSDRFELSDDLQVDDLQVIGELISDQLLIRSPFLFMNFDGPDGDQTIWFFKGTSLGEFLRWNDENDIFQLSDDLDMEGNLTMDGSLSIGQGSGDDADFLFFDQGAESLTWNDAQDRFVLSDDLFVLDGMTVLSGMQVVNGDMVVTGGSIFVGGQQLDVPDYVFEDGYPLMTLEELQAYVSSERHLPNMPSTADIRSNGLDLSQFQMLLLEKAEELTLYTLAQEEKLGVQKEQIAALEQRLSDLEESGGANVASAQPSSSGLPTLLLLVLPLAGAAFMLLAAFVGRKRLLKRRS